MCISLARRYIFICFFAEWGDFYFRGIFTPECPSKHITLCHFLPFLNLDSEYREVLLDANILIQKYFEPRYIYYWYSSKVKSRFTIQGAVYSLGERCLKISKATFFRPFIFLNSESLDKGEVKTYLLFSFLIPNCSSL